MAHPGRGEDLRALALISLGSTEFWAALSEDAEGYLQRGVALARRIGRPYLEFSGLAYQAATGLDGSFGRALDCARHTIELAERHGWTDDPAAGVACVLLGAVLNWQGRPEEAEPWVQRAEATLRVEAEPAAVVGLYIVRGELELARNHDAEALAALEAAERLVRRLGLPLRTVPPSRALLLQALVRLDETERAKQFLTSLNDEDRERGRSASPLRNCGSPKVTHTARWLSLRRSWPSPVSSAGQTGCLAYVLEATIRDTLDDEAAAEGALERALDFAEPNGLVAPFLSYVAPGLLERHARRSSPRVPAGRDPGALAGATLAPPPGPRPLLDALSDSELRVLRYLPHQPDSTGDRPRALRLAQHRQDPHPQPVRQTRHPPSGRGRRVRPRPRSTGTLGYGPGETWWARCRLRGTVTRPKLSAAAISAGWEQMSLFRLRHKELDGLTQNRMAPKYGDLLKQMGAPDQYSSVCAQFVPVHYRPPTRLKRTEVLDTPDLRRLRRSDDQARGGQTGPRRSWLPAQLRPSSP